MVLAGERPFMVCERLAMDMEKQALMPVINQERISRLYRYLAPVYGPIRPYWTQTASRGAERYLEKRLVEFVRPDTAVLDLGCGPASNLERLRRLNLPFGRYVGLDLSQDMLSRRPKSMNGRVNFVLGDAWQLPFAAESFDLVISTWMFSHLGQTLPVVQAAHRLLRPGGWLLVACFARPDGFPGHLVQLVEPLFLMRCVPWPEIQSWPGRVEVKRFLGGVNAAVCLRRE